MNKLKETRKNLGMTQAKLAEWLKCPQTNISKFEAGIYTLSIRQVCALKKLCELKGIEFKLEDYVNEKMPAID